MFSLKKNEQETGTKYTEFSRARRGPAHHTPYRLFRTCGPPAVSGLVRSPASHFDADDSRACSTPLGHAPSAASPRPEPAHSAHGSYAEPSAIFVRRLDNVGRRLQRVLSSPRDAH
ncbi:hypothetical protein EVAR_94946_1 [Eumeta japonica]|uniref:Uncharacterized protein n=1 Tax=Eumeta variegata TaxID=151549 RepID=A0A4C1UUD0_EUMVA|nr:hypothetical protein EVAR_94946_1 [Eumeta japonica]